MISQEIINEILLVSNIVDVIGEFIQLKKIGNNYKGLSPFSNERIPSLIVSPYKKIWKDFSSGKGGNIITFLMEYEKLSYPEAIRWLANKYDIHINNNQNIINKEQILYKIHKLAKNFFIQQLNTSLDGIKIGLVYLQKRNIQQEIIKKFELGYASKEWKNFINFALNYGYNYNNLELSGLLLNNNNHQYDRYRNSIMFPIHNINGIVIGFGARLMNHKLNNNLSKYINSPESTIYYKSHNLYGIYQAKKYILKTNFCYLVEGYTDVLSLYQTGIKNVVATLGTSLSIQQILLIKKFTNQIIILYDGDLAGIKGSLKIIDNILKNNLDIKIVYLGKNEDPHSICEKYQYNLIKINNFIKQNIYNFIQFKIFLLSKTNQQDIIKKEKLIINIIRTIAKISNNLKKELYIQELSKELNINKFLIYQELSLYNNILFNKNNYLKKFNFKYQIIDPLIISENIIINFILLYGNTFIQLHHNKKIIKITVIEKILYEFNKYNIKFILNFYQKIFNYMNEEFQKNKFLSKNILEKIKIYNIINREIIPTKINITNYLNEILLRHISHYISKNIDFLIQKSSKNTEKDLIYIKNKILSLTKLKIQINQQLNRYV